MGFGDLKTDAGVKCLNEFLTDKSYIEGYTPSQADTVVFAGLVNPPATTYVHALRWYSHIKSYGNDTANFPGTKKAASEYGPEGADPVSKKEEDDDDDFELFGSDDEEEKAAAEKLKEERLAAYAEKKSKTNEKDESKDGGDDDDFDLFGSDDEETKAAADKLKQRRVEMYAAKKAKKAVLIAKSSIILDVKPWDDETDMKKVEELVRTIKTDGLVWGASKLVPLAYGIKKLQIICVVEDDKVGTDFLEEEIGKFEDYVQSVDIAAFNKI